MEQGADGKRALFDLLRRLILRCSLSPVFHALFAACFFSVLPSAEQGAIGCVTLSKVGKRCARHVARFLQGVIFIT